MRAGRARVHLVSAVFAALAGAASAQPGLATPTPSLPQALPTEPADTFADGLSRELVTASVRRRPTPTQLQGLRPTIVSRLRVGFELPHQFLWRDRNFYRRERTGLLTALGTDSVAFQVAARNRGSPLLGDGAVGWEGPVALDPENDRLLGMVDLGLADVADEVLLHPGTGEIHMLGQRFLDPLGRRGRSAYRFRSGDTIRVALPAPMTLMGVQVTPRPGLDRPMTGILWYDVDTRRLVRMVVQPEGRWELTAGLQGALRRIPLIRTNAQGEVDFLSIDFGPDPDGSVVPLRAFLRGRAFWLSGLYEMPIDIEWTSHWNERGERIDPVETLPPPLSGGWAALRSAPISL